MISILAHQVNKSVLVSMPSVSKDSKLLVCTLIGIEPSGLWLESNELVDTLAGAAAAEASKRAFVPFAQIAFLLEGSAVRPSTVEGAATSSPPKPRRNPRPPTGTRK